MDLSKSAEFFNPATVPERLHIIGCGSVGSVVAELLARFGLTKLSLYDFDKVEPHNLVNQLFGISDIFKPKTEQLKMKLLDINQDMDIQIFDNGWNGQILNGYVFLCVDNIDLRRKILNDNKFNDNIKAVFDFRTGLTNGQHYAADWNEYEDKVCILSTMDFSHEEAEEATPMSACHVPLCVAPTVRLVANVGVCNFINFAKGEDLKKTILVDAFKFTTTIL